VLKAVMEFSRYGLLVSVAMKVSTRDLDIKNESSLACRPTVGRNNMGYFLSVIRISNKAYQMMEREVDNEIP